MSTTWNPSDKSSHITLSGGNLTAAGVSGFTDGVRATASLASGKWYWEILYVSGTNVGGDVGVANSGATLTANPVTQTGVLVVSSNDGAIWHNSTNVGAFGAAFANGDTLSISVDTVAGTIAFRKNNGSPITISGANVPTGPLFPFFSNGGATDSVTANFGATATTYTPPSGYSTIDSTGLIMTMSAQVFVGGAATFYPPADIASAGSLFVGGAADMVFKSAFVITSSAQAFVGGAATWEFPTTTLAETLPPYASTGSVINGTVITLTETLPPYAVDSFVLAGAVLDAELDLPAFTMFGDFGWFAANTLAVPDLTATALVGTVSSGALTLPVYTINAGNYVATNLISGANDLPVYVVQGSTVAGGVGTVALLIPAHRLVAAGFSGAVLDAELELPAYALVATGFGQYTLSGDNTLPVWQLDAAMSAAVAAAFRTWVLNLHNKALTEYTNFSFNSFASTGGRLFAAGPSGIVELTEQTDDNGADIAATVRTGKHNFGVTYAKRVPRIYTAVATEGDLEFRTITGADGRRGYLLPWNQTTELQQRRIPVGRGPKSVYWQFEFVNRVGADFQLEALTVRPELTLRRVV